MSIDGRLSPGVEEILRTASERAVEATERVSVDARPLEVAIDRAERAGRVPVIAEVKPTSPTTEGTRADDPVDLACEMVAGGACAISVLTESEHFGGSCESLMRIRETVDVPVLRKDFVLEPNQLDVVPADLLLVIVRFVDDLDGLLVAARERGFQPLVEVHDGDELQAALSAGAEIIGVNNRDLETLSVDLSTFESVAPAVPEDIILIAESGVSTPADVRRMREAGADALLVGSAIMDGDVRENTQRLVSATRTDGGRDEPTGDGSAEGGRS